jgi:HEAT repeat protein
MLAQWHSAPPLRREAILKALGDRAGVLESWIIAALRSDKVNDRLVACALLERIGSAEAEAALLTVLDDPDARVASQALLSLGAFGSGTAADAVREQLATASDARKRKAILAALGNLGDDTDLPRISPYLADPDEPVRVNAAAALARLGDASGEAILLASTHGTNPQARREATYALGFLDSPEARQRLEAIAADPQARWRTEADIALEMRLLRHATSDEAATARLGELALGLNDELAEWARDQLEARRQSAAKHVTDVHGGGVLGNPGRSITANAFAVLNSPFYTARDARDTAEGTVDEDIGARPINHFYNPVTGLNTMPARRMDAVVRSEEYWRRARLLWRHGPRNGPIGAAQMLGRSMHMLQDMTSPAHVHDDPHVPPLDPDDFERWGESLYPVPEEILPGLVPYVPEGRIDLPDGRNVSASSPAGLVHGMALFTYELTAIPGDIAAGAEQSDSELARMFPDGRLYYQDAGILGANYWQIDDVGPYGLLKKDRWWPCAGDFTDDDPGAGTPQRITGRFYLENVSGNHGGLVPAAYERPLRHIADPAGMSLLEIQAGELYPEVVERSAAFLAAFEDDVPPAPGGCASASPSNARTLAGDSLLLVLTLLFLGSRKGKKTNHE